MTTPTRFLHLAAKEPNTRLFPPAFLEGVAQWGTLEIILNTGGWESSEVARRIREADVLLTGWGHAPIPPEIAANPGNLRYICHLTGEMTRTVPIEVIRSPIPVTNWGDAPAFEVAEAAFGLLLACLKNLRPHIEAKRSGDGWRIPESSIGSLYNLRLGIYGFGFIGRAFYDLCQPFQPRITVYDPYAADCPAPRADSLEELFANSDAVVIHAGLTDETRHSITERHFALLPDHGIVVNTARGGIVDQEALFAELATGRLRAALDVLDDTDSLLPDHPARQYPNLILTAHQVAHVDWPDTNGWQRFHAVALDNLRRFHGGAPLRFIMDETRYLRST
jgi:phosphoglycerate dehydrogenase-like enzyme